MRTQVAIIGAGPSGLLLSQLLHLADIDCVVLEQRSADYVLSRIRAGVLEQGMVDMLDKAGVSERMFKEGLPHDGVNMSVGDTRLRIDLKGLTGGKTVMVYGQTEVTKDLMDAHTARDAKVIYEAEDVTPIDFDTDTPRVTYKKDGVTHEIACDFICGCDGYHGISRASVPRDAITEFEKVYPIGWLGILSYVKPVNHELIYANHDNGFALASMRSHTLSRYYIQVPVDTDINAWPDDAIWDELKIRLGEEAAASQQRDLDRGTADGRRRAGDERGQRRVVCFPEQKREGPQHECLRRWREARREERAHKRVVHVEAKACNLARARHLDAEARVRAAQPSPFFSAQVGDALASFGANDVAEALRRSLARSAFALTHTAAKQQQQLDAHMFGGRAKATQQRAAASRPSTQTVMALATIAMCSRRTTPRVPTAMVMA